MHANYIRKAYLSLELGDGELMTGKRKLVNYCCSLIYSMSSTPSHEVFTCLF